VDRILLKKISDPDADLQRLTGPLVMAMMMMMMMMRMMTTTTTMVMMMMMMMMMMILHRWIGSCSRRLAILTPICNASPGRWS
jgi:predicted RND superfamily exporter protein